MTDRSDSRIFEYVPSPFSGTALDNLKIAVEGLQLKVLEGGTPAITAALELR